MRMLSRLNSGISTVALVSAALALPVAGGFAAQAQSLPPVLSYTARTGIANIANPSKVARDKNGDIFVLVPATPAVYEIPVNGPVQIVVPSTDASIAGDANALVMTADAAGNLYVAKNNNEAFTEIPRNANGTYNYSGETTNVALESVLITNNYSVPADIAVDTNGNIYSAVSSGNATTAFPNGKGILMVGPGAPTGRVLYSAATAPTSITIDYNNNVFYADGTNLWELTAANIASGSPVTRIQVGGSTSTPAALAASKYVFTDATGDLYTTNGTSQWYLIPNTGAAFSTTSTVYALPNTVVISGYTYGAANNNGDLLLSYGGSLELYGAGKYYDGSSNTLPGLNAVGLVSNTSPKNPTSALVFTQATTLNTPFETVSNYNSANGAAAPNQATFQTGNSTCAAGTAYAVGGSCAIEVGYYLRDPGAYTGVVQVTSSTGAVIANLNASGQNSGSALAVDGGKPTTIGTGYLAPAGLAVDNTGATYVADPDSNAVYKYAAGSTAAGTAIGTGLSEPTAVTIDAAGDVFIADTGNDRVVYLPSTAGALGTQVTLATGAYALSSPRGLAVDSFGNLFIADTGNSRVLEVPNPTTLATGLVPTLITSALNMPYGLAFDASNNLFIADAGANAVYEVPTALFTYSATANVGSGTLTAIGTGLSSPTGVATDASGTVYIADAGNARIVKVPYVAGAYGAQTVLFAGLDRPFGIATDITADLYYTDQMAPAVEQVLRSATSGSVAATIPFGSVMVNGTANATVIASNTGLSTSLTFSALGAPTAPFTEPSTTCSTGTPLTPGSTCSLALTYAPVSAGASTQNYLQFTDNALGVSTATQRLILTGAASGAVATVTLTGATTAVYGDGVTFVLTAKDAAGNAAVAANGTYSVSITGAATATATVTLSGGTGSFFLPTLGAGSYTLMVTVSSIAATANITVTKAPLYLIANNVSRAFDVANPLLSASFSGFVNGDTSAVVTGTAPTISTTATRVSPAGTYAITFAGGTLTATNYTITQVNGVLTVTGTAPQIIFFTPLPNFANGSTVTLTGFSSSGLPITYSIPAASSALASINGNTLTVTGAGAITVVANQAGNVSYAAASSVSRTFTAQ
jgi:sugar lactone lactonase YvrE